VLARYYFKTLAISTMFTPGSWMRVPLGLRFRVFLARFGLLRSFELLGSVGSAAGMAAALRLSTMLGSE
jgi:hypothetical protein